MGIRDILSSGGSSGHSSAELPRFIHDIIEQFDDQVRTGAQRRDRESTGIDWLPLARAAMRYAHTESPADGMAISDLKQQLMSHPSHRVTQQIAEGFIGAVADAVEHAKSKGHHY
ncbi:MAG: hypothetical protein AB7L92_00595 [Alphaproteobacteria bacterium]